MRIKWQQLEQAASAALDLATQAQESYWTARGAGDFDGMVRAGSAERAARARFRRLAALVIARAAKDGEVM